MAVAWSWAFDTPFKWTKQVASHFGGTRQGMAISWPARIKDAGGVRHQFHHIIDIVPTILEATGDQGAADGRRHHAKADRRREHGLHVRPGERQLRPRPARPSTSRWSPTAGSTTTAGTRTRTPPVRAVGSSIAKLPDVDDYKWELYNLAEDYSQDNDLAAKMPDKLKEMQALFQQEALKYNVLPLDNSQFQRAIAPRPSAVAGRPSSRTSARTPASLLATRRTSSTSRSRSPPRSRFPRAAARG